MKKTVNYSHQISKKAVTITWSDGTSQVISASDRNYGKAIQGISNHVQESSLRVMLDTIQTVAVWSNGSVVTKGGATFCKTPDGLMVKVPIELSAVLQEFIDNDWPALPFCRFVYRLLQNPSQRSVETFYSYVEKYGLTITDDGMVRGYKAVTSNFLDKHSQTVDNSIGASPLMPRNKVDDDPDASCSTGFHFGSLEYVKNFAWNFGGNCGDRIILIEADPANIVCVPRDCNCGKVRCCTYTVVAEFSGELAGYAGAGLKSDQNSGCLNEDVKQCIADINDYADDSDADDDGTTCPVCGSDVDDYQSYCGECGSRL